MPTLWQEDLLFCAEKRFMDEKPSLLIKYGGNAMLDENLQSAVVDTISQLHDQGYPLVVVHGGGPFIQRMLDLVGVESTFIEGQRRTTPDTLRYVEMVLKGEVNSKLVHLFNRRGLKAIGLSGKDGKLATARRKRLFVEKNGQRIEKDLGQVGEIEHIDVALVQLLLGNGYLPVLTGIAADAEGNDLNINADIFAGHLAAALQVDHFFLLTNIDGLLRDLDDPASLIDEIPMSEIEPLIGSVIQGGMLPKIEACRVALEGGVGQTGIINGVRPDRLVEAASGRRPLGTYVIHQKTSSPHD